MPYTAISRERYARRAVIELADIPGGYGWVFPKTDHANIGVGAWQSEGPRIREHLRRLCEVHGLAPEALEGLRGIGCRCVVLAPRSRRSGRCCSETPRD